jgi:RimJ/RimL family protein N-acetyltransferase
MSWSFRKIGLEDFETLLEWRNNPEVYRHFFSPYPVPLENHKKWIEKVIQNPQIFFLIASYEQVPAGTVNFDFNEDFSKAEVGIYLDPKFHGKRLGGEMLSYAEKEAIKKYPQLKKIIAKVLVENIASEKMFEKVGYQKHFVQLEKNINI